MLNALLLFSGCAVERAEESPICAAICHELAYDLERTLLALKA